MKRNLIFLFSGIIAFLSGCSDDAEPRVLDPSIPIYQNLAVDYDITGNYTNVAANFKTNNAEGVNLRMQDGGVTFNGTDAAFIGTGNYMYEYRFDGTPDITFVLKRIDVGDFTNKVEYAEVVPISIPDTLTSVAAIQMIYWVGAPIEGNEYVVARLVYKDGQSLQKTSLQDAVGVKIISYTSGMKGQTATLYLSRVRTLPIQESDGKGGGQINVSYTVSKQVVLR